MVRLDAPVGGEQSHEYHHRHGHEWPRRLSAGGGDLIISIDDQVVRTFDDVWSTWKLQVPGETVTLTILRAGKGELKLPVTLGERPRTSERVGKDMVARERALAPFPWLSSRIVNRCNEPIP